MMCCVAFGLYSLYFGIWCCIIGGIVEIIVQIKSPVTDTVKLTWSILGVFAGSTIAGIGLIFAIGIGSIINSCIGD